MSVDSVGGGSAGVDDTSTAGIARALNGAAAAIGGGHRAAATSSEYSWALCWPRVAVVMPVKGCRPHSAANWSSILASDYPPGEQQTLEEVWTSVWTTHQVNNKP